MLICPECGQAAEEGAKFCERCGQGLGAAPSKPAGLPPLEPGTELKGGFRIAQLIGQSSDENRYRASRENEGNTEFFQLRERIEPARAGIEESPEREPVPAPSPQEDPNGPRAKTRELKLQEVQQSAAEPAMTAEAGAVGGASDAVPEEVIGDGEPGSAALVQESDGQLSPPLEPPAPEPDDLGETFGRVLGLSLTLRHPAFQPALAGFSDRARIYLVYPDEELVPLDRRQSGVKMTEAEAMNVAVQVCQGVSFLNRRGLRLNDICPASLAYTRDGRIKITSLDYVSNDDELQSDPIFNDGYTAPEIYRGRAVDKRADVFSIGCLLYTWLTGQRLDCETWREEAGPVIFYPPHVVMPELEQAVRRAICFKPADRWPNAEALKTELLRISSNLTPRCGALTDVGMVREHNEDSILVLEHMQASEVQPAETFLYVVSDGMGGAEAGETASAIAVSTIRDYVENGLRGEAGTNRSKLLQAALEEANRRVLDYQVAHPESRGMGATVVAALILPPEATVAWVGDSRVYLCERGQLRQLTKDHSLVQRLVDIGQITAEQARHHEHKNVITRSLGARQTGPAGAETLAVRLKRGDRLVLCSDGLTTHVDDAQIKEVICRHSDPHLAAKELLVAANAGGGTDNISVITVFAD